MRNLSYLLIIGGILLFNQPAKSQDIQWADSLVFQYNNYGEEDFSGNKVIGSPDSEPYGRLNRNAFRLNSDRAYGTFTVAYANPIRVSQIIIIENFLPNRVAKVILIDTEGNEHKIYEPDKEVINIPARVLNINIDKTKYKVGRLSIHLNSLDKQGWAEIDAVGISEKIHSSKELDQLIDLDNLDFEESVKFAAEKEKLTENINTSYAEAKPILSPDGKILYFVRQNAPENFAGKSDDQDIYYSSLINGKWTLAQNIGSPLNDKYPNGICSISPDGNKIWVINAYGSDGEVADGISESYKMPDGTWSKPEKLEFEEFQNLNRYQDYFVSASGKTLLMAIETEETFGDQDIYVSFKKDDGMWTKPKNLGRIINTENIEYAPFLSADEKILYFSSNGHAPQPESDVYYSKRLDDTWLNWSKPTNIGYEINTSGWDSYFAISANSKYAYFVSTDGQIAEGSLEQANKDIYRIPLDIEPAPENIIVLSGKVFNKNNNLPVYAKVHLKTFNKDGYESFTMSSAKTGDYTIKLSEKGSYELLVEAEGFIDYSDTLNFNEIPPSRQVTKYIDLDPVLIGQKFNLDNLFFVQSKADLLPESEPALEKLYSLMLRNPSMKIELGGYTDNQGYKSANIRLSQERADAVGEYLLNRGVDRKRIKSVGYGPSSPIAPNDTEENRARNRRVEVTILEI